MEARLARMEGNFAVIETKVLIKGNGKDVLSLEEGIQAACNKTGLVAMREMLKRHDTDGSPIEKDGYTWRTKGKKPKTYQTPYGKVEINRHTYQCSRDGKTFCPLEYNARIIVKSTLRFAKLAGSKSSRSAVRDVQRDFEESRGINVPVSLLQRLTAEVADIAHDKEEKWSYGIPELKAAVKTIAISLDGTCMLMCSGGRQEAGVNEKGGWREAMTGSLSLYDEHGKRMHTIYIGAPPEHGKGKFLERLTREIELLKKRYPNADFVGIADGAKCNWDFLDDHTDRQILDYYHATIYLGVVAKALPPGNIPKPKQWFVAACHMLKHEKDGAQKLYKKMREIEGGARNLPKKVVEDLSKAVTYFKNHKHQMNYPDYRADNYPIGSGVIEAACKVIIKQRMCLSGMRWKNKGATDIIALRSLERTDGRWQQFWQKISRYGFATPATGNA